MNHFDLRKAITEGNRSSKLYRQSMLAAFNAIQGEKVIVLGANQEIVDNFIKAVIRRIQENPMLDYIQKRGISKKFKDYNKNPLEKPEKLKGNLPHRRYRMSP